MKTIGIIGGVGWESTAEYYRLLNQRIRTRLGAGHSAELAIYSLDFARVAELEKAEKWGEIASLIVTVAHKLESMGARSLLIASNTLHKVAEQVESAMAIPLIHIADAIAARLSQDGVRTAGLLGTRFVMEQDFYRSRLRAAGLDVRIPDAAGRSLVHDLIFDELTQGKFSTESRGKVLRLVAELKSAGAESVVLACTELPLLIRTEHTNVRLYDSVSIHVDAAIDAALG